MPHENYIEILALIRPCLVMARFSLIISYNLYSYCLANISILMDKLIDLVIGKVDFKERDEYRFLYK